MVIRIDPDPLCRTAHVLRIRIAASNDRAITPAKALAHEVRRIDEERGKRLLLQSQSSQLLGLAAQNKKLIVDRVSNFAVVVRRYDSIHGVRIANAIVTEHDTVTTPVSKNRLPKQHFNPVHHACLVRLPHGFIHELGHRAACDNNTSESVIPKLFDRNVGPIEQIRNGPVPHVSEVDYCDRAFRHDTKAVDNFFQAFLEEIRIEHVFKCFSVQPQAKFWTKGSSNRSQRLAVDCVIPSVVGDNSIWKNALISDRRNCVFKNMHSAAGTRIRLPLGHIYQRRPP